MTKFTGSDNVFSGNPFLVDEANPTHDLGERMMTSDGRQFRYARAGATLVLGNLLQGPAETTGAQSRIIAAAAVGDMSITTTDTLTATANQFAGGWVIVTGEASTGTGGMYRIKSHPAVTAGVVTFQLEDPVQVACTATTQVDIVENPYHNVLQLIATPTTTVVGVAVNEITSGNYGWIQTKGVGAVLNDSNGAIVVGNFVTGSKTTAGACRAAANDTTELFAPVGVAVTGIAQSEVGAVMLNLA